MVSEEESVNKGKGYQLRQTVEQLLLQGALAKLIGEIAPLYSQEWMGLGEELISELKKKHSVHIQAGENYFHIDDVVSKGGLFQSIQVNNPRAWEGYCPKCESKVVYHKFDDELVEPKSH